uniref:Uncharacterized protein n=1 Tax=Anguilla anguilla TaxID=7936 RepID=A0A0E9W9E5_ANGAN
MHPEIINVKHSNKLSKISPYCGRCNAVLNFQMQFLQEFKR